MKDKISYGSWDNTILESIRIPGFLREWSTMYEELRDGVGQYPVGIIENFDGTISVVAAENIKMIKDDEEWDLLKTSYQNATSNQ